jgi:hypothetical protein
LHGEGRNPQNDGTWGWDYVGRGWQPGRIFLNWCHCVNRQPSSGAYRTDGHPVPDVLASPPGSAGAARSKQCESEHN